MCLLNILLQAFPENAGRFKNTFSPEQVAQLKEYVVDINKRAFGLTKEEFSRIAYNFAEGLDINHRFNKEKKTAGKDFVRKFMAQCNITLRKPEATSTTRLTAFNKVNVDSFFSVLKELRMEKHFKASQIYNVDESGFSTVPTKTPKVLSPVGNRRVMKLASGERGQNVTAVCCMNAAGHFVPPLFIFPRVRMQPSFLDGAPAGSVGIAHETGWMTSDSFVKYLEHFVKHTNPSITNPLLLLMDNHSSHVTLDAINFCRDHHVVVVGFPAHTTHRLQPLDVSFYGPLKTAYSKSCENFLVSRPGTIIAIKDVSSLFCSAYNKVASVGIAVNGFRATGIEPFDDNIFTDEDFEASKTTDKPQSTPDLPMTPIGARPTIEPEKAQVEATVAPKDRPTPVAANVTQDDTPEAVSVTPAEDRPVAARPTVAPEDTLVASIVVSEDRPTTVAEPTVQDVEERLHRPTPDFSRPSCSYSLPALPVAEPKVKRKRRKLPSLVLSSSPVKKMLEETKEAKEETAKKRKERLEKRQKNSRPRPTPKKRTSVKSNKTASQMNDSETTDDDSVVVYMETDDETEHFEEMDCIICGERGKNEVWYQCFVCKDWAHAQCTGWDSEIAKVRAWECDFCN